MSAPRGKGEKIEYSEIVAALARKTGNSEQLAGDFTKAFIKILIDEAVKEGKASISGFGSLKVVLVAERQAVNPQTGEKKIIPPQRKITFNAFKALQERVNKEFEKLDIELIGNKEEDKKELDPRDEFPDLFEDDVEESEIEEPEVYVPVDVEPLFSHAPKENRKFKLMAVLVFIVFMLVVAGFIYTVFLM